MIARIKEIDSTGDAIEYVEDNMYELQRIEDAVSIINKAFVFYPLQEAANILEKIAEREELMRQFR